MDSSSLVIIIFWSFLFCCFAASELNIFAAFGNTAPVRDSFCSSFKPSLENESLMVLKNGEFRRATAADVKKFKTENPNSQAPSLEEFLYWRQSQCSFFSLEQYLIYLARNQFTHLKIINIFHWYNALMVFNFNNVSKFKSMDLGNICVNSIEVLDFFKYIVLGPALGVEKLILRNFDCTSTSLLEGFGTLLKSSYLDHLEIVDSELPFDHLLYLLGNIPGSLSELHVAGGTALEKCQVEKVISLLATNWIVNLSFVSLYSQYPGDILTFFEVDLYTVRPACKISLVEFMSFTENRGVDVELIVKRYLFVYELWDFSFISDYQLFYIIARWIENDLQLNGKAKQIKKLSLRNTNHCFFLYNKNFMSIFLSLKSLDLSNSVLQHEFSSVQLSCMPNLCKLLVDYVQMSIQFAALFLKELRELNLRKLAIGFMAFNRTSFKRFIEAIENMRNLESLDLSKIIVPDSNDYSIKLLQVSERVELLFSQRFTINFSPFSKTIKFPSNCLGVALKDGRLDFSSLSCGTSEFMQMFKNLAFIYSLECREVMFPALPRSFSTISRNLCKEAFNSLPHLTLIDLSLWEGIKDFSFLPAYLPGLTLKVLTRTTRMDVFMKILSQLSHISELHLFVPNLCFCDEILNTFSELHVIFKAWTGTTLNISGIGKTISNRSHLAKFISNVNNKIIVIA